MDKNVQIIGDYAFGYCETETGVAAIENFTIYGYACTTGEIYTSANGFEFVYLNLVQVD